MTLDELAAIQNVKPADAAALAGTWPGEVDDGFEEMIDQARRGARDEDRMTKIATFYYDAWKREHINSRHLVTELSKLPQRRLTDMAMGAASGFSIGLCYSLFCVWVFS